VASLLALLALVTLAARSLLQWLVDRQPEPPSATHPRRSLLNQALACLAAGVLDAMPDTSASATQSSESMVKPFKPEETQ
jgi:hypothetical protein